MCKFILYSKNKDDVIQKFKIYIHPYLAPNKITKQQRYDIHFLCSLMLLILMIQFI